MLIVQKYGGTSVADPERIRKVATRILESRTGGTNLVVVVSAMAGETNHLDRLAHEVHPDPIGREYDMLLATGEQVTSALLALALQAQGAKATPLLGRQVRIVTDSAHAKARIKSIDASTIHKALGEGEIVVVAGFQGTDEAGNITTLGRGGSDTTAVALAAALKADACEIYSDVDGVYTADPRLCPEARKLSKISYEEMLELASAGAKVLQHRSVELAAKYHVPLWVRSTFKTGGVDKNPTPPEPPLARSDEVNSSSLAIPKSGGYKQEGTLVTDEDSDMEKLLVSGVTYDNHEAKVAVRHLKDEPGIAARLFQPIADANINVDMIVQNVSADGYTDLTFTVPKAELTNVVTLMKKVIASFEGARVETDEAIAKVSVVGVGMRSHAGVAATAFSSLARAGINIEMISTSEIKISMVVRESQMKKAVNVLHQAFELEKT